MNQRHHASPGHIVGLYVQAGDGRVLLEHLSHGQSHGVVSSSVGEAEESNVCVRPQSFSESDESFLKDKWNLLTNSSKNDFPD